MDKRLYFLFGDVLGNALTGALVGWACAMLVDQSWHMLTAMLVGMCAGMGLSLLLSLMIMPLFGGMEVMIPVMLTGMLAGMWLAMVAAMAEIAQGDAALLGACVGMAALISTWLLDAVLRSRRR